MNLGDFAKLMNKRAAALPTKASAAVGQAVLAATAVMVMTTPVDTGRARGGWRVNPGEADTSESTTLDKQGGDTVAQAAQNLLQKKPLQPLVISNYVPYVIFLDMGSSKQAPAGMTPAGLRTLHQSIESIKLDLDGR